MEDFGLWGVAGGIVLTAGVTTLGTWWVTRYTLKTEAEATAAGRKEEIERHATFLAVRVASILDPFVMSCIDVVNDKGAYDARGERTTTTSDPALALPQDVDWKSIDPHHMDLVLTLPNEIMNAEKSIAFLADHIATPPDYEEIYNERQYQWARIGLLALNLAAELRERYGLSKRDYSRYDPRDVLERAFKKEDEMRNQGAELAKRLTSKHRETSGSN